MTARRPGTASPRWRARARRVQFEVYSVGRAYGLAVERMTPMINKVARSLAQGDTQLFDDYVQEARIAIWDLDPARFDETDEKYFRRAVVTYMRMAARRERRQSGWRGAQRDVIERALEAAAGQGEAETHEDGEHTSREDDQ